MKCSICSLEPCSEKDSASGHTEGECARSDESKPTAATRRREKSQGAVRKRQQEAGLRSAHLGVHAIGGGGTEIINQSTLADGLGVYTATSTHTLTHNCDRCAHCYTYVL